MSTDTPMELNDTNGSEIAIAPPAPMLQGLNSMTENEQSRRRASIREIMQDETLTALERRRSIQSLMDGRRRDSGRNSTIPTSIAGSINMLASAAAAAADFYDSDDDSMQHNALSGHNSYGYNSSNNDDCSASSLSSGGGRSTRSVRSGRSSGSGRSVRSTGSGRSVRSTGSGRSVRSTGSGRSVRSGRSVGSGRSSRGSSRNESYRRASRAASLKAFATSAAAAALAVAAQLGDDRDDGPNNAMRMEKSRPDCEHYERQCSIISPCCQLCFGCRICHDECPVLPPPRQLQEEDDTAMDGDDDMETSSRKKPKLTSWRPSNFADEDTHHLIDRFMIKEVICRQCYTRQSSKSNFCIACKIQFGDYHCNICNLWMSDDEDPYHCLDCGFCRVGGRQNFRHCHDCGMCIDALLFDDHNCKAGKYMSNCPVCQEDLFSSRSASHEMPCGHAIHWHCFRELTSFDTRCPVCKKTAETHDQMQPTWSAMAMGISLQPVPPEMARVVTIICNDCEELDEDRRWHFLGVQCMKCSSFNTTVEKTTLMGREAAVFLGDDLDATPNINSHRVFLEENIGFFSSPENTDRLLSEQIQPQLEQMATEQQGGNISDDNDMDV